MEEQKTSRKFVVWIVFGILTALVSALIVVDIIVTKSISESMGDLLKTSLTYFFWISLAYLGVNVGQKIGLNLTDKKVEETTSESEVSTESEGEK
jgi:uncharacterized protein YacL